MLSGPLEGVIVLDFTRVLAGPFCAMILADLGAEVIKIERPKTGDDSRAYTPIVKGESAYFMSINRGKKSVTLDLKNPKGKEIALRLGEKADILIENFKPGVMEKLGLSYEAFAARNPRIIYASCSGFGQYGPLSEKPAYDLIVQGLGGIMSITGPDKNTPTKVGSSIADIFAGVFTAIGILAALHHRESSGKGQYVDVAMLDCMVAILENAIARYVATGVVPEPIGNRHPSIAPFATFKTQDGHINIACGNNELWRRLCVALNRPHLYEDARFKTNADRVANWADLEPLLQEAFIECPTEKWLKEFDDAGIPAGKINNIADVVKDPHVLARDMIVDVIHPVAGSFALPGIPVKLSMTPGKIKSPAPVLGQHNEEVLTEYLGMTPDDVNALKEEGVI
ncbi:MAG TPA: CoA transferase [Acetomicrobium flavidum]|uniref:CaiB/BaiF CoA transferase family protein n=1 Tax=Acetomicrobium flavidum TaxID=49896 RepID=UPI002CDA890C|nr:CoA transferase [Acetomicrobium flavidum]